MPLSEFELKKIKKHISMFYQKWIRLANRHEVDFTYRVLDNEVWMFQRYPTQDNPTEWEESAFARLRCDLETRVWTLYWQDNNLRWYPYDRLEPTRDFQKVLEHLDEDPLSIFWV